MDPLKNTVNVLQIVFSGHFTVLKKEFGFSNVSIALPTLGMDRADIQYRYRSDPDLNY